MTKLADQQYLLTRQYQDASNLEARMALHNRFSTGKIDWQRWVFDHLLELDPTSRILEVGCGPAKLWLENKERIPTGWYLTLVDFSAGMVQQAQANFQNRASQFVFKQADAQALPFADVSFDAVVANHMLYHVPDKRLALSEFRRVLKPGGLLLTATNGQNHMRELDEIVKKLAKVDKQQSKTGTGSFALENGQSQLEEFFSGVRLEDYANNLRVTEAGPFVAYVLSESPVIDFLAQLPGEAERTSWIESLEAYINQEITAKGAVFITKHTGLFVANKEGAEKIG